MLSQRDRRRNVNAPPPSRDKSNNKEDGNPASKNAVSTTDHPIRSSFVLRSFLLISPILSTLFTYTYATYVYTHVPTPMLPMYIPILYIYLYYIYTYTTHIPVCTCIYVYPYTCTTFIEYTHMPMLPIYTYACTYTTFIYI